jgi:hypothetical protein
MSLLALASLGLVDGHPEPSGDERKKDEMVDDLTKTAAKRVPSGRMRAVNFREKSGRSQGNLRLGKFISFDSAPKYPIFDRDPKASITRQMGSAGRKSSNIAGISVPWLRSSSRIDAIRQ